MAATPDIERELRNLRALTESFALLGSTLDLAEVLQSTLHCATDLMDAETGSIALYDEERESLHFAVTTDPDDEKLKEMIVPRGKGVIGHVAETGVPVRIADVSRDERHYSEIDRQLKRDTSSYLCVPLRVRGEVIGTIQLLNRRDNRRFEIEDEQLLLGFAAQAALAIYNAHLHGVELEQKALDTELALCNEIQMRLYPKEPLESGRCRFFGDSQPSRAVGGDYYTFIDRGDGSCDFAIADVSGKGVSAALLVSEIHTGLHLASRLDRELHNSFAIFADHMNETMSIGRFISIFLARIDIESGEFSYINAGHQPPLILGRGCSERELSSSGAVLGLPDNQLQLFHDRIEPGELLFTFTDGYSEAMNATREQFGEERLYETLCRERRRQFALQGSLATLAAALRTEVLRFSGERPLHDDATLLLLEFGG